MLSQIYFKITGKRIKGRYYAILCTTFFHNTNCLEFSFIIFLSYCLQSLRPAPPRLECIFPPLPSPWHTLPVPSSGMSSSTQQRLTCETDLASCSWDQCPSRIFWGQVKYWETIFESGRRQLCSEKDRELRVTSPPYHIPTFVILCTYDKRNNQNPWFYVVSFAWNIIPFSS